MLIWSEPFASNHVWDVNLASSPPAGRCANVQSSTPDPHGWCRSRMIWGRPILAKLMNLQDLQNLIIKLNRWGHQPIQWFSMERWWIFPWFLVIFHGDWGLHHLSGLTRLDVKSPKWRFLARNIIEIDEAMFEYQGSSKKENIWPWP